MLRISAEFGSFTVKFSINSLTPESEKRFQFNETKMFSIFPYLCWNKNLEFILLFHYDFFFQINLIFFIYSQVKVWIVNIFKRQHLVFVLFFVEVETIVEVFAFEKVKNRMHSLLLQSDLLNDSKYPWIIDFHGVFTVNLFCDAFLSISYAVI